MVHAALAALAAESRLSPLERKILKAQGRIAQRMFEVMDPSEALRHLERVIAAIETMREETLAPNRKAGDAGQEQEERGGPLAQQRSDA